MKAESEDGLRRISGANVCSLLPRVPWESVCGVFLEIDRVWREVECDVKDQRDAIQPVLAAAAAVLEEAREQKRRCAERVAALKVEMETLCRQLGEDMSAHCRISPSLLATEKLLRATNAQLQETAHERMVYLEECQRQLAGLWEVLGVAHSERMVQGVTEGDAGMYSAKRVGLFTTALDSLLRLKADREHHICALVAAVNEGGVLMGVNPSRVAIYGNSIPENGRLNSLQLVMNEHGVVMDDMHQPGVVAPSDPITINGNHISQNGSPMAELGNRECEDIHEHIDTQHTNDQENTENGLTHVPTNGADGNVTENGYSEEGKTKMVAWEGPVDWVVFPPTVQAIAVLEEALADMAEERVRRKRQLALLRDSIRYLCERLEVPIAGSQIATEGGVLFLDPQLDDLLTDEFVGQYEAECQRLKAIQRERLREFVDQAMHTLVGLWNQLLVPLPDRDKFYAKLPEPYTAEGLDTLNAEVIRLRIHLERARVLYQMINQRKAFIQKMLEFERSASDKSRLFGSSVRLLQEERFRKTAYPTLLAMEKKLLEGLAEYRDRFDEPFQLDGLDYSITLKAEIASRPLNEEVFGIGYKESNEPLPSDQGKSLRSVLSAAARMQHPSTNQYDPSHIPLPNTATPRATQSRIRHVATTGSNLLSASNSLDGTPRPANGMAPGASVTAEMRGGQRKVTGPISNSTRRDVMGTGRSTASKTSAVSTSKNGSVGPKLAGGPANRALPSSPVTASRGPAVARLHSTKSGNGIRDSVVPGKTASPSPVPRFNEKTNARAINRKDSSRLSLSATASPISTPKKEGGRYLPDKERLSVDRTRTPSNSSISTNASEPIRIPRRAVSMTTVTSAANRLSTGGMSRRPTISIPGVPVTSQRGDGRVGTPPVA